MKQIQEKFVPLQGTEGNVIGGLGNKNIGAAPDSAPVGTSRMYIDADIRNLRVFFERLAKCQEATCVTDDHLGKEARGSALVPCPGKRVPLENALIRLRNCVVECHERKNKVIFVGNGGSAAICSHMAVDWTKNGGIRSIALNDAPTLTCLSNDFGYDQVFAKQLEYYAHPEDVVIIISSSGKSPNITEAGRWCSDNRVRCITFSGMNAQNKLRLRGWLNFWVPAMDYGLVELTHMTLLHSIVSIEWQ